SARVTDPGDRADADPGPHVGNPRPVRRPDRIAAPLRIRADDRFRAAVQTDDKDLLLKVVVAIPGERGEQQLRAIRTPLGDLTTLPDLRQRPVIEPPGVAAVTVHHPKDAWVGADREPGAIRRPRRIPGSR